MAVMKESEQNVTHVYRHLEKLLSVQNALTVNSPARCFSFR